MAIGNFNGASYLVNISTAASVDCGCPQERADLREASKTDNLIADFSQLLGAAQEVISDDPVTVQAMDYLVYAGYITNDRKNNILNTML
jgi:hypothetical protein